MIPKIKPPAQELKNGPGINGTGARKTYANNPNRNAPRDDDPVIRRTIVPVNAAAASKSSGRTMKCRASRGVVPKIVIAAAASHISPQWYQVWVGNPWIPSKPDGE